MSETAEYDFDSTQPLPDISGQTEPLPDVRGIPLSSQRNRTNTSVSRRTFLQRAAGVVAGGIATGVLARIGLGRITDENSTPEHSISIQQTQEAQQ